MSTNLNVKRPKLSVVVIAFNNELYIEEALESLNEQTFDDFEVVVVNDFSSDRTGELIDRYIEGKPKFKAIHLKENSGGCSTPRNTGIRNSTGEYIMFLDGDDWYTIDACEKMVNAIERVKSDFVAGQVIRTNNYEIWYHNQIYSKERINISVKEFSMLLFDSLSVNKIYKRSFLEKHNLSFPEGIHYEDIVFTGKAYFLAESVSIIPEPIYYWRVVENADVKSITNRRFEFDNFKNRIISHRMFDQFLRDSGNILYQSHKNNKFLRHDLKLYTNDYLLFDEDYKDKFHKLIYEYMHEVMDEYAFIKLPEKERIMYYLLYIGDKEAFQDYLAYLAGLPTSMHRVYSIGDTYYFRATRQGIKDQKFLNLTQPIINYNIYDMKLSMDHFTIVADMNVGSMDQSEFSFSWVLRNSKRNHVIHAVEKDGNQFEFDISRVEPGNYYLSLWVRHQGNLHKCLVKSTSIEKVKNLSTEDGKIEKRILINGKNSFAIQVLPLTQWEKAKWFFQKRATKKNNQPSRLQNGIANIIKDVIKKLPVKSKWVLFESHMGKQYSDSPKYIYQELLNSNKNYKFIWSFEDPDTVDIPGPAIKVKRHSLKHYYYLNRSKYWVDNQGMAKLAPKKKSQVYIQTWHGTPLKRMGYDQKVRPNDEALAVLKKQTNAWNYFLSPNDYSTEIFKRAFRFNGEILEYGYPRNDLLINKPEKIAQKVMDNLNLPSGKRVIMFAPTFRDWDSNSYQNTLRDIRLLSEAINDDSIILLRLHYLLSDKLTQKDLPDNVINASSYQDIQELYLISDILITDYSSVMFDYALLKRPIILYCYDLDEYVTRRGTYFDLNEVSPGPVCKTLDEVILFLNNPDRLAEYNLKLENFSYEFGNKEDGQAAKHVVEKVFI